jgi:hypothetical protein
VHTSDYGRYNEKYNYEHIKQNMYEKNNLQFHLSTVHSSCLNTNHHKSQNKKHVHDANHRKQIPRNEPSA